MTAPNQYEPFNFDWNAIKAHAETLNPEAAIEYLTWILKEAKQKAQIMHLWWPRQRQGVLEAIEEELKYRTQFLEKEKAQASPSIEARSMIHPLKWKKSIRLLADLSDWLFEEGYLEKGEGTEKWALLKGHFIDKDGNPIDNNQLRQAACEVQKTNKNAQAKGMEAIKEKMKKLEEK